MAEGPATEHAAEPGQGEQQHDAVAEALGPAPAPLEALVEADLEFLVDAIRTLHGR